MGGGLLVLVFFLVFFLKEIHCIYTSCYRKKRTPLQSCRFACAFTLSQCLHTTAGYACMQRKMGYTQLHLAKFALMYLQLFTHKKEEKKKEHLSHVSFKEELEKLTSHTHSSSLALSRSKQFSWWRAACWKYSRWSELVFLTEPNLTTSAPF